MEVTLDHTLAIEAKAMVALAFRNGPIEDLHGGKSCEACAGSHEFSRISKDEMKAIMKSAVDTLYRLLWQRENDSAAYLRNLEFGERYTRQWDDPELKKPWMVASPNKDQNP